MQAPVRKRGQRGVAVVTALLVVALVVSLIAGIFLRQAAMVRSLENTRLRAQTVWMADGLVDAVRIWLQVGARNSEVDHLGQDWARPLTQAGLVGLLASANVATVPDIGQMVVRGYIEDAQSRFNLSNLLNQAGLGQPYQLDSDGIAAYGKLLAGLSMNPGLASLTAAYLLRSMGSGQTLAISLVEDLQAIPGYTPEMVARLSKYVVILPQRSAVNVNTAGPEVLAAVVPNLTLALAQRLVSTRNQAYIQNAGDLENRLRGIAPGITVSTLGRIDVKSGYFLVRCQVRNQRANITMSALIERQRNLARFVTARVIWAHEAEFAEAG